MKTMFITAVVAACSVMLLSACGDDDDGGSGGDAVVQVCGLFSETGDFAAFDGFALHGVRMAAEEINSGGGFEVDGTTYTIGFSNNDTRSDTAQVSSSALDCVDSAGIIMGPMVSVTQQPVLGVIEGNDEVLYLAMTSRSPDYVVQEGYELMVSGWPTLSFLAEKVVPAAIEELDAQRFALLWPNDTTTEAVLAVWEPLFAEAGAEIVEKVLYDPETTDFTSLLLRIKDSDPDAIFFGYSEGASQQVIRQTVEQEVTNKVLLYGQTGIEAAAQEPGLHYVTYLTSAAFPTVTEEQSPELVEWEQAYTEFSGEEINAASQFAMLHYCYLKTLPLAMETAGSVSDLGAIREAYNGLDLDCVQPMEFDDQGIQSPPPWLLVINDGEQSVVATQ